MVWTALPAALFGLGGVLYRYRPEGDKTLIALIVVITLVSLKQQALEEGSKFEMTTGERHP